MRGTAVSARVRELHARFYGDASDLRAERARYLAPLAAWCNVPPWGVDRLTVTDFITLTRWIDRKSEQRQAGGDL